mgnify:FL=1
MAIKLVSAVIAVALLLAYLLPIAIKLKEASLAVVAAVGVGLMLRDLWESLRHGE